MDSLTHIVIGAAIGDTMLRKEIGRKGALIGALAKTIPDFDLFYTGLDDPFAYMCHHRGHTHSLFWELIYAIPLAILFYYIFKKKVSVQKWFFLFLICLWGHSLLDVCTNYGTRLFLPFTQHAYSWNNMAIADIFFTLPMLILLIGGLCFSNISTQRKRWINSLFVFCFLYLGYTGINKMYANNLFQKSLDNHQLRYDAFMTNPTILNNFLWYGIAKNDSDIYISERSLLFPQKEMRWLRFKRHREWLEQHPDKQRTEVIKWFSQGYDIAEKDKDTLNVYCVKFGRTNMKKDSLGSTFIFHYKLFQKNGENRMTMEEPTNENANFKEGFIDLYERIMGK